MIRDSFFKGLLSHIPPIRSVLATHSETRHLGPNHVTPFPSPQSIELFTQTDQTVFLRNSELEPRESSQSLPDI